MGEKIDLLYKAASQERWDYVVDNMKIFLENYSISGSGRACASPNGPRIEISPEAGSRIERIAALSGNSKGEFLDIDFKSQTTLIKLEEVDYYFKCTL